MTKEMIEKLNDFKNKELEKCKNDYYKFESDIFKEIRKDKEQEEESKMVCDKFCDFQKELLACFLLDDSKVDSNYYYVLTLIDDETQFQGLNPQNVVYEVLHMISYILTVESTEYLELDVKNNMIHCVKNEIGKYMLEKELKNDRNGRK